MLEKLAPPKKPDKTVARSVTFLAVVAYICGRYYYCVVLYPEDEYYSKYSPLENILNPIYAAMGLFFFGTVCAIAATIYLFLFTIHCAAIIAIADAII